MSTSSSPERDAENKGLTALGTVISVSILSTLFTAGRLYVRCNLLRKTHLDDYLIIASVICGWANVGTAIADVLYGSGRHFDLLDAEKKQRSILGTIAGFPAGVIAFGLPKLAVVALLPRIVNPSEAHRTFLWSLALFCQANLVGCVVILFAQCQPSHSQWDFSVAEKTCRDKWILVYFAIYSGGFCAFVDTYPAVVLAKLQMRVRKKIALSIALGIGSISFIVAIYKCTRLPSLASADFSYDTADLTIWTIVEGSTMIIAACIPALQPLGELLFGRRMFSSEGGKYNTYENYGSGQSGRSGIRRPDDDMELSRSREARKRAIRQADEISLDDATTTATATTSTTVADGGGLGIMTIGESNLDGKIVRTDVFSVSIEQQAKNT